MSPDADTHHTVLRARIGLDLPPTLDRTGVKDHLAAAIARAVEEFGGKLDVLQLDVAARPDWDDFGPTDRVSGQPLWERRRGSSSQT